nr:hypothetical protein B0A51_08764 [Rachicladosporium sp. CCFEE 5018]
MVAEFHRQITDSQDDGNVEEPIYIDSALTMEPAGLLQHGMPMTSEYGLTPEQDCIDHYGGHAHHPSYSSNATNEPLRRDGSIAHQPLSSYSYPANGNGAGPRYLPERHDPHSLDAAGQILLPPPVRSDYNVTVNGADRDGYAVSNAYEVRNLLSPPLSQGYPTYLDAGGRNVSSATAGLPLQHGAQDLTHHQHHQYRAHPMAVQSGAGAPSYPASDEQTQCAKFPFPELTCLADMTCEGEPITPNIHAKVEKGFFFAPDKKWTCYRRNYFSVICSFDLHPMINNGRLEIKRNGIAERVQAMGMKLTAAVDGSAGKNIELVLHTPKRDNGPKLKMDVFKVAPSPAPGRTDHTVSPHGIYTVPMQTFHPTGQTPGPYLPLQHTPEENSPTLSAATSAMAPHYAYAGGAPHMAPSGAIRSYTFERVQFKQATANNGKRRASQQFFHLVIELFADVRKDGAESPTWVNVAKRVSDKIVVRGRSPSHYSNEGVNGIAGRGGASGGGGNYGMSSAGGYSANGMNQGGFRSAGSHGSSSSNGYSTRNYALHHSPEHPDSHSGSSASSIDGGPVEAEYGVNTIMTDAERMAVHEHEGYQYYPTAIYESVTQLPPLGTIEQNSRTSTEPYKYAVKAEYADAIPGAQYASSGLRRFEGVSTSQGYFPDLRAGYA